mmetsp:Transcript_22359/g.45256  ORF Transcript_22359/g.45256 Transcript_22359/m.45256 type:complete len:210 (+) Transcript_22359:80-709(+)
MNPPITASTYVWNSNKMFTICFISSIWFVISDFVLASCSLMNAKSPLMTATSDSIFSLCSSISFHNSVISFELSSASLWLPGLRRSSNRIDLTSGGQSIPKVKNPTTTQTRIKMIAANRIIKRHIESREKRDLFLSPTFSSNSSMRSLQICDSPSWKVMMFGLSSFLPRRERAFFVNGLAAVLMASISMTKSSRLAQNTIADLSCLMTP